MRSLQESVWFGMDAAERKRWIKDQARALGFQLVGVAPPTGWPHADAFPGWIDAGYHADMAWIANNMEQRTDVGKRFSWARSVIMVGMSYRSDEPCAPADRRPFSRYAWGADYHDLLATRLKELGARIEAEVPRLQRWHWVDTGPILERSAAAAAGLGWLAKNTLLIDQTQGSFLFLGALVTDLDLPFDREAPGRCGTCDACLTVCPTQAFPAPYLLDARRCISYLTIEHRGAIPHDLRTGIGELVFGCDLCQDVCPWNERAARETDPTAEAAFRARPGLARADLGLLLALLSMDQATFSRRFRKSPIKRAKRRGLARNAAIALGNRGDLMAIPGLRRALRSHDEPLVRGHAAWALGQLARAAGSTPRGGAARLALRTSRESDPDPEVREEARTALPRD